MNNAYYMLLKRTPIIEQKDPMLNETVNADFNFLAFGLKNRQECRRVPHFVKKGDALQDREQLSR